MKKKSIIIIGLTIIIISVGLYFIIGLGSSDSKTDNTEKQLYTCGMHPDVISDEPGNCPICGMKLVPKKGTGTASNTGERKILYWRAPMDPNEIYDAPGKSKMGMDLVPVYEDNASGSGIVSIDPTVVQNMNVKTALVEKKALSSEVITNGVLTTNEKTEYILTTRVNGWVENLYINYTGQPVAKGQKLMDIYSPELVAAQQELITALNYQKAVNKATFDEVRKGSDELLKNAIRKLELLEIPESDIEKIMETRELKTYVSLYAQSNGTVLEKNVLDGQKIMAGMPLLKIANLSNLWLTADVYEYELSKIQEGSKAEIRFNYFPGKTYEGKVSFIYPTLESKTRTAKIRIDIPNPKGELKPSMFANVIIEGKDLGVKPVIPENAVLRGGRKDIVIIALAEGKFKPQEVILGGYSDGYYQVLNGLSEGTRIVTSAQFLIDSESNLRAAVSQFKGDDKQKTPEKEVMPEHNHEMTSDVDSETKTDTKRSEKIMGDDSNAGREETSPLIRTGVIDLKAIDKNKDGNVFQDFMDWNVISDEPGRCPICNMILQQVSLDEAKKNLIDNGFKVK
ncbi:MAG TPA: efflux RND transporter periplasmic adaptor subunit [Ignavibacteriales bacterium]|nr:efflux RND transporter periplasmic adaptor subunit [Ignavibacteriales bacterium]